MKQIRYLVITCAVVMLATNTLADNSKSTTDQNQTPARVVPIPKEALESGDVIIRNGKLYRLIGRKDGKNKDGKMMLRLNKGESIAEEK